MKMILWLDGVVDCIDSVKLDQRLYRLAISYDYDKLRPYSSDNDEVGSQSIYYYLEWYIEGT